MKHNSVNQLNSDKIWNKILSSYVVPFRGTGVYSFILWTELGDIVQPRVVGMVTQLAISYFLRNILRAYY